MPISPLRVHVGRVAALLRSNVDTDSIIPKQFLKRIERTGFGPAAFFDWRYRADGTDNPDVPLNQPLASGASILLAGANFGCGCSREHAPWALGAYGFRVILAESFADIFAQYCVQNGMLAAVVAPGEMRQLFIAATPGPYELVVDLERCEIRDAGTLQVPFAISAYRRIMLLAGHDEIARTLGFADAIDRFEAAREWPRRGTPSK